MIALRFPLLTVGVFLAKKLVTCMVLNLIHSDAAFFSVISEGPLVHDNLAGLA